jgi:endoglucanase
MTGSISVSGNQLLRDGEPFVARGVIFTFPLLPVSLFDLVPENADQADYIAKQIAARAFYFEGALPALQEWGVNTIRFNLFEGALDVANDLYSPEYADDVREIVSLARSFGFTVILCLFDAGNKQTDPGTARRPSILYESAPGKLAATSITLRAFRKLARMFGDDDGVILETLNEPYCGWPLWLDGGDKNGEQFVGVNALVKMARRYGAENTILCCGPSGSFAGFPGGVRDPLNRISYSIHPFFGQGITPADWDANFGNLAQTAPVVLSAWNASPQEPWCTPETMRVPQAFLDYLRPKGIGLIGYAFDVSGTIVRGLNGRPTKWPAEPDLPGGPGELLKAYFTSA